MNRPKRSRTNHEVSPAVGAGVGTLRSRASRWSMEPPGRLRPYARARARPCPRPWHLYPDVRCSAMPSEAAPPRELHCRVLFDHTVTIDERWKHQLCNPYWRLYRDDDDGAWIDHPGGSTRLDAGRLYLLPAWGRF